MWLDGTTTHISTILSWLWRASWQAAVLALLVLLLQLVLKKGLTARWRYNLWLIVLLRLLMPVLPESPLSIYNLLAVSPVSPATGSRAADPIDGPSPLDVPLADVVFEPPTALTNAPPDMARDPSMQAIDAGLLNATAPPVAPAAADAFPWASALASIWLLGVLLLLARIVIATIRLHRLSRRLEVVNDAQVLNLLETCKRDLGVRRKVIILSSREVAAPALMGALGPKLLLPSSLLNDFDRRELRLILMHELAHVRRRDVAVNWIATLLHTLHWFNPVLWLALSRMRTDRELATDELVLAATHADDRQLYGQTILKLLQQTLARRTVLPGMVGILEQTHPLRRRITMIAQFDARRSRWSALAVAAVLMLAAVTLTDSVRGQDAGEEPANPPGGFLGEGVGPDAGVDPAPDEGGLTDPGRAGRGVGGEYDPGMDPRAGGRGARGGRMGPGGGRGGMAPTPSLRDELRGDDMDPKLRAIFERNLPEVNFVDVPFADVIEFLRDVSGANLFVNWRALEHVGVDRETPVTMRMKNVSFVTVLRLLLDSTAPGVLRHNTEGGVIIITADAQAQLAAPTTGMMMGGGFDGGGFAPASAQPAVTRVYDVRELLGDVAAATAPRADTPAEAAVRSTIEALQAKRQEALNRVGARHPELVALDAKIAELSKRLAEHGAAPGAEHHARASRLKELVEIIRDTVGQEQPIGIRGFNTKLIVRASADVQSEVQNLLKMLGEDTAPARTETNAPQF